MRKEEREILHELLIQETDNAQRLEVGSEEAKETMANIKTLVDLVSKTDQIDLEERKVNNEENRIALERDKFDFERTKLYLQAAGNDRKAIVDTAVQIGLSVANMAFYGAFLTKGWNFETTGTIGSTTFRNLLSGIKPPKM